MKNSEAVSELDLLAYADGLLDHDPGRKARVEAYLRGAPAAAKRAEAYRAQTRALRETYEGRATEPVPDRLHDALRPRAGGSAMRITGWRAAAMVAVSLAAGATGWHLGQLSGSAPQVAGKRLPSAISEVVSNERKGLRTLPASLGDAAPDGILRWKLNGVGLSLSAPDLSSMGFELSGRRDLSHAGTQAIALTYAGAEGARLRLLIAPVASGSAGVVSVSEQDGARLAHWSQGPLTMAVQVENGIRDLAALARDVRDTIARAAPRRREQTPPEFPMPPGKVEVTADAVSPQSPEAVETPAGPATIGADKVIE